MLYSFLMSSMDFLRLSANVVESVRGLERLLWTLQETGGREGGKE